LFIKAGSLSNLVVSGGDDFNSRFNIIDNANNMGVFDTGSGNPFTRSTPADEFTVSWRSGVQGTGLYIQFAPSSAIPEPGSMVLGSLAAIAAGWYGRRRKRGASAERVVASKTN
jgi:hypothetical protein